MKFNARISHKLYEKTSSSFFGSAAPLWNPTGGKMGIGKQTLHVMIASLCQLSTCSATGLSYKK